MESFSRPFHRRKLSNPTGKNPYAGVFSDHHHHRQNITGSVSVNVDEYHEIFSTSERVSSIPVLDLTNLNESNDYSSSSSSSSSKPDYGSIFGGFRDLDIAVNYQELLDRDKFRATSSTSQSSHDLRDESHQSSDALKQFNLSYNKINQRSKNGLDGTTHVTQLHAVPGFTCFIDESASQPKKETVKQSSSVTNNDHPTVNSSKRDLPEKQTSESDVESRNKHHQDDNNIKTFPADLESHPPKVSSPPAVSQPKKEMEKQKSVMTNNIDPSLNSSMRDVDLPEKQTSRNDEESVSGYGQVESLAGDTNLKTFQPDLRHSSEVSSSTAASTTTGEEAFQPKKETEKQNSSSDDISLKTCQADHKSHPSSISSSSEASAANLDNYKDYQKRSHATNSETFKSDASRGFFPTFFDEDVDVNSAASVSTAALRKAIEKAQESIRIAKESVGRKKEGLRGFSSKSFKDSLKVKRKVVNVNIDEEPKETDVKMKASQVFSNERSHDKNVSTLNFSDFADSEKLFGAKQVINEIHGKISESAKTNEIPLRSSLELNDDKIVCKSKEKVINTEAVDPSSSGKYEYATRSSESIENSIYEAPQEDNQRPNGFLVFKSFEENIKDNENKEEVSPSDAFKDEGLNNLTVYEKVEYEKKIPEVADQNGYEKRFSEVLGLLENKKQEVHEQEHDEKMVEDEIALKEEGDTKIHKEEDTSEKFYDVCEAEIIENAQTYILGTSEVSPKEDFEMNEKENHETVETWKYLDTVREPETDENSSSDYDDAEGSESVHSSSHIVIDTREIDDLSSSSEFQVDDNEDIEEKEIFENIYVDQTISEEEDECESKSDDLSNRGLADMDFGQNDEWSESSSDSIHGMEIEVKEYKEREETIVSEDEEEINLQPSHEETETPDIGIKTETEAGTSQEPKDEVVDKEQTKRIKEITAEERERERIKLAVERAIREARERAFIEARERAERAAVERATAEARQRVMADAQERVAKVSDNTSAQSKLRAERAAVERATSEARQRALEKAMSQKKTSEPKIQINEIKQTSSSVTHTSAESALRSKAKLEKHNRIMERTAKALAEKEKRDLLVLREQAERNRLSENLDADIKRWSSGKEGNLRALLSTLQYILGAESGWQAVSLTDIITASAVKKAYRKATLCVHPDKLQQRGASIQQKYICEKVFDLLKAAWNRFNSEER